MRFLKLLVLVAALSSTLLFAGPHPNGRMTANAGTRFSLGLPDSEGVMLHVVDGVAQLSVIGDCLVHFEVYTKAQPAGVAWPLEGTMYFVYPEDNSTLHLKVKGWFKAGDGTPIGTFHYDAEIVSGDGQFAGARGTGEINGAAMFIDAQGNGTATWTYKGRIFTRPAK